jgi:hypothetical protein
MDAEQRSIVSAQAKQSLEDPHWRDAFRDVESYIVDKLKGCDTGSKEGQERAANAVNCLQMLEALKRELYRKVEDGEMARVEIRELEKRRGLRAVFQR